MSHTQEITYRWLAGVLVAIVLGMIGAWAHDISNKMTAMRESLGGIQADVRAVREVVNIHHPSSGTSPNTGTRDRRPR